MMNIFEKISQATKTIPVDVEALASDLDVDVSWCSLPEGISGKIEPIDNERYKISINKDHPETRQRFTLAHEIGHFVFHRHMIDEDGIVDTLYREDTNTLPQEEETEANQFAANLLMPKDKVREYATEMGRDVVALANLFNVSPIAMEIRLDNVR